MRRCAVIFLAVLLVPIIVWGQNEIFYQVNGTVFKEKNKKALSDVRVTAYKIMIVDEKSTEQLVVEQSDHSLITKKNGAFSFDLSADQEYVLSFAKKGYELKESRLGKQNIGRGEKISVEVPLQEGETFIIEGNVMGKESRNPLVGAKVTLNLPSRRISSFCDENGRFFFGYSAMGAGSFLEAKHSGYLQTRNSVGSLVSPHHVTINFELEKSRVGDQTQLESFFFKVNSALMNKEGEAALQETFEFLKQNPSVMLEIGCHSDARGEDLYNLELSQKRATAIRQYLIYLGVSPSRLVAKGYGEEQILNACANGVLCTTEQHLENRRIVFTVIGGIE